jgi:hypothetical protein
MVEPCGKDWRALCAAAARESDSDKLADLVQEILQAFDDRDRAAKESNRPGATLQ